MRPEGFSLIVPTRARTDLLDRLLTSVRVTASRLSRIEVVLYVDDDDEETLAYERPDMRLVKHVGPRTTMGRMTRACCRRSTERNLFLLNDDVVFRSPGWDEVVLAAVGQYPDGVALVYGNDLHQGGRLPTFPILPRVTCELLGWVCPGEYLRAYIDAHLVDVFLHLRQHGHDRICYLPQVIFEHLHADAGKGGPESASSERWTEDELTYIVWAEERKYLAYKLARHIEQARKSPQAVDTPRGDT